MNFTDKTLRIRRTLQRVQQFEGDTKTKILLVEPKTLKSKSILPLTDDLLKLLNSHRKAHKAQVLRLGNMIQNKEFMFMSSTGRLLEPRELSKRFEKAIAQSGVKKTNFHTLRHSFCSMSLMAGIELKTVSDMARHSTIALTAYIYGHILQEKKIEAVNKLSEYIKRPV